MDITILSNAYVESLTGEPTCPGSLVTHYIDDQALGLIVAKEKSYNSNDTYVTIAWGVPPILDSHAYIRYIHNFIYKFIDTNFTYEKIEKIEKIEKQLLVVLRTALDSLIDQGIVSDYHITPIITPIHARPYSWLIEMKMSHARSINIQGWLTVQLDGTITYNEL